MSVEKNSEELMTRLKERAKVFVLDNIENPTMKDFLMIENAMLIGASLALAAEEEFDQSDPLDFDSFIHLFRVKM